MIAIAVSVHCPVLDLFFFSPLADMESGEKEITREQASTPQD